jgi:anti-anti-sigma factor
MIEMEILRVGKLTVLQLQGRMDSASYRHILDVVEREIERSGRQVILDLSQVEYISTLGLKVLRRMEELGEVRIAKPSTRVREVLQITGLDATYKTFPTSTAAIYNLTPVVNAHTHLEMGWLDDYRPGVTGESFTKWILGTVGTVSRMLGTMREKVSIAAAERGVEKLIAAGTTTVGDISRYGASIEPLLKAGMRGVIYLEVLGINAEHGKEFLTNVRTQIERWGAKLTGDLKLGLSIHSPYSVTRDVWKEALKLSSDEGLPLCIHAAESPEEREFFLNGNGAVAEHIKTLGMDLKSPGMTPIAYLEDLGALAQKPLLVHCVQVDTDDVKRIKASGSRVVHCPRSNLRLRCGRMPLEKFLAADVPVYLGTDSLGSSPSLNILDEMEVAVALHHGQVEAHEVERLVYTPFDVISAGPAS